MSSRAEVTTKYARAYARASKKDKGRVLDQVVAVTGWSRDNARRRLVAAVGRPPGVGRTVAKVSRKRRAPKYSYDAVRVLQKVWAASGGQCGKYLAVSMPLQLAGLERHGELVDGAERYDNSVREECATLPVPVRIKQASYHLIVCADSPRSVTEQREDNNCAASPGTIKAGTPRVIVSATADTGGSIAASSVVAGTCSGTACSFPAGAGAITFTATASSGYRFGEWTGSTCAQHSGSATDSAITFTNPTAAHSCVAVFVKQVVVHWSAYLQWAQVGGCGQQPSTQPGSCTVDAGGTVVLVVKPETGFTFTGQWTATGGLPCDAGQSTFLPDGTAQVALTNLSTDESCEAQMQAQ